MGGQGRSTHVQLTKAYLFDMLKQLSGIAKECDENRVGHVLDALVAGWESSNTLPALSLSPAELGDRHDADVV